MGGPKFLFVVVLALLCVILLVTPATASASTTFPLEEYEWVWCFGKANIGSRLSADIASSGIASADLKWMNPQGYVVDDALIAGSGPYDAYNDLLSMLQIAYNHFDYAAKNQKSDIHQQAEAINRIGFGISEYGAAISEQQVETRIAEEMEKTGLHRIEEVVPLGLEKTSAAKFYEKISEGRAANSLRSRNLDDVEKFGEAWSGYLDEYRKFAETERFVFFNLANCSKFSSVSLKMCNFGREGYWICGLVTQECLPWALCKDKFERDLSILRIYPPSAKEAITTLKLHSPLSTLKEEYSEFVGLMAKARETEASLKAEDGRLADSVEGLLLEAEGEELRLIDAKIADKIYSASDGNNNAAGLSSILKAKAQARLSSFSETIDKTANSLEGDREALGKISGREEKYSEESRAGLYNRIKDLKIINERLAGEKTALSGMLEDAVKLDESASAAVEEMKASLLGNEALWPLDRLRISDIAAYKKGSSTGMSVLAKYETILELERMAKRIGEAQNSAIENQLEEIEGRTEELRLLLDVAGSPIEKTFGNGMHGEGLLRGKLGKIATTLDGVKSDISKIRRSEGDNAEKNLLILALGMKLDSALDELRGLNDEMHEKPLNAARFSARTALDNAVSAGIPVDEERKQFAEYERHFAGSDWIDSSSGAFGFMGWLEAGYEKLLESLTGKFDEASESFFSNLPVEGSYAFPDSAILVANAPTLVRAYFTISNPSSIAGGSRLYSTKLERLPVEKIGSKNVIDSSDGVDGVYSGGDRIYLKAKYLKPRGAESALVEYYAEPAVMATVVSKSEKATVWKYSLEENITVTCGTRTAGIEVPVQSQLFTAGAGLKITAISSNGRALEWLNTPDGIAVKSSCSSGNHSIRFAAEFAEPIDVSVSKELKSSAGGLTNNLHRLELRNRLGIELRDVEMEYELPPGAGEVKINGKTALLADGTSTLYWKESRFASYGSASATVTFSTTATNVTDTLLLDQEIDSIINSLPKCDWESCCEIKKLLEDENGKATLAGDPVARYLAKSDFLSWLKKNSPFIDIFSMESAGEEYKALASAKAEMCSLKISKAIEAVRKAEAEKKKRDKEEKAAISAKALILRREARMLDERLSSLQATAKAFPELLKDDAASLTELERFSDETTEDLILAETEGNATRLSEAEARLARLKEGIGSEAKKMADIIHGASTPSNNNGKAFVISVPENITAKVEERFPGVVVTVQPENVTRAPSGFEKSYSNGDYEGALKIALDGGLEKEAGPGTLSKDANGKIALAVSKLAELERLAKIKQAPSKGEAAGYLEDAKSAYGEGRFADASYLALYAYSKAEDEISELAGLKTPIDIRPMAALALLLAAGFVIHINKKKQKSKKMAHSRKTTATAAIKPEKESEQQEQDSVFFGELK